MNNSTPKEFYSFIKKFRGVLLGLFFSLGGIAVGAGGVYVYTHSNSSPIMPSETSTATSTKSTSINDKEKDSQPIQPSGGIFHTIFRTSPSSGSEQPTPVATQNVAPIAPQTDSPKNLQIQNVQISVSGTYATVTWTTTSIARSQLILDNGNGKGYESENGVGTSHQVSLSGLAPSASYDFKIVAHTTDGSLTDDYYGSIESEKIYTASLSTYIDSNGCRAILIEDTAGNRARNETFTIHGSYTAGTTVYQVGHIRVTTDEYGLVTDWSPCAHASANSSNLYVD